MQNIPAIIQKQKEFFNSHTTKDVKFRLDALERLREAVIDNEQNIYDALHEDLGKSSFESYASEVEIFLEEIRMHIKKLKSWSNPKKVKSPIAYFPAKSLIYPEPYGIVLIIAPWNYPFLLLMDPLIGAISAGNCVVLKPADYSRNTSDIIDHIIKDTFNEEYIAVVRGGREVNEALLNEKYDYIFFTGSPSLGRLVMEKASKNLTPITLELGGKSPCIVDKDANIKLAAKRITWGKYFNTGQTCVCPDYLFVHEDVKDKFINEMKKNIELFYSKNINESNDYGRIINEKHFDRLSKLIDKNKLFFGGDFDKKTKYISPTILLDVNPDDPVMKEEIFGPIAPVMTFKALDEVVTFINSNPKPLALYYFGGQKNSIINNVSFGGGCINDTLVHVASPYLPFGGVGNSGMGSYHGKNTFDTFTHYKSVLKNSNLIDMPFRYPPYKNKLKLIKMFIK
jgi:aldehyde dehydrogenase (NAD+)